MADEPTFIDLYALTKITPESVVERFGSTINSSFFDASNILGGLKIKGLIDFTTLFGSQNAITLTDQGKALIDEANKRAADPMDALDMSILTQLSGGKRSPTDLSGSLNVNQKDLAMRLYKLQTQEFLSSDFRNGTLGLMLTEKGFMQAKTGLMPPMPPQQPQQQQIPPLEQSPPAEAQPIIPKRGKSASLVILAIIVVVVIALALWQFHIIPL